MEPLDPNKSFLEQLTEPDPTYGTAPLQYPQPRVEYPQHLEFPQLEIQYTQPQVQQSQLQVLQQAQPPVQQLQQPVQQLQPPVQQPLKRPQPQLFASQQSKQVVNQLVAPYDYLQTQRNTLAQRINSARLENVFVPPSTHNFSICRAPVQPRLVSFGSTMDKRHPSSFQQLEKVCRPSQWQYLGANDPAAGRGDLCNCMHCILHGIFW